MVVFTGASVEEAIQTGLKELELSRIKARIRVLAREKKGFLGFGKKPAQVDVEPIYEKTESKPSLKAKGKSNRPASKEAFGSEANDLFSRREEKQPRQDPTEEVNEKAPFSQTSSPKEVEEKLGFEDLGIALSATIDIKEVVACVTDYVQQIVDEMDVEAELTSDFNRRTINMQIDTNEPGRIIGYHGKILKSLQLLAQNYLYNRYAKNFYISINVNDYVEHRAEVLQSYAQKLADRVLESQQRQHTDPMSNNERKIIHRIISRIEGVTSYSEGDEPNRYVVVDIEG